MTRSRATSSTTWARLADDFDVKHSTFQLRDTGARRLGGTSRAGAAVTAAPRGRLLVRGLRLEYLTVGWNIAEGLIAVRRRGWSPGASRTHRLRGGQLRRDHLGARLIWRLRARRSATPMRSGSRRSSSGPGDSVAVSFLILAASVAIEALDARRPGSARCEPGGHRADGGLARRHALLARAKRETGEPSAAEPSSPIATRPSPAGTSRRPPLPASR